MTVPPDALSLVRRGLHQAGSAWEMSASLVSSCAGLGVVGWALMLAQEDGSHLFPCGISGLSSVWEPPLRPLERSDSWPACMAALGCAWTGHGFQRPYPLPLATSPAAAAALPLRKSQGTLVALRPGRDPFTATEEAFLSAVAEEVSDALAGLPSPHRADVPRLREVVRGAFTLNLTEEHIWSDSVFAEQHGLPGPGRHPLSAALAALPPADRPTAEYLLAQLTTEPGTYEIVYRVSRPNGTRTLQARCSSSPDARGQVVLTGHATDITLDTDDATARETRMRRQMLRAEQIRALASACASVGNTSELAAATCDVLAVFGADAIVLAEAIDERLHILTSHGQQHLEAMRGIALSTSAPLTDALREHRAVFAASHEELIASYPHYANTAHLLDRQAWAAMPIPVSGPHARPAACMLSFNQPHAFTAEDHALFIAAAGLLGPALDRCRAWDVEHTRAVELQKGLLPASLPQLPDTELTALYLPAAAGAYAGGDWYDALVTGSGSLLLAVGDIEGHDTQAASLMGRLRTAIRAYAALTDDPSELLHHTNRLLTEDNDNDPQRARTATCCLVLLTPATGEMRYAVAGHPPPLIYSPQSGLRELPTNSGPPLGIFNDSAYPPMLHRLADDAQLLLHTDGLTDRSGADPAHTRVLLHNAFAEASGLPAAPALDHITTRCLSGSRAEDDCALLLVRRRRTR